MVSKGEVMKKLVTKILSACLACALLICFGGCQETINGSVVSRVNLDISYSVDGETSTINSTLTLYETFAPKTTERIKNLVKDGFYNNTVITLSEQQDYAIVGGFTYGEDYAVKEYNNKLEGEFTNAGLKSENTVKKGALVMLRDFDTKSAYEKYDTAKASFAIVLTDSGIFDEENFCVFGYIDDASLKDLTDALVENAKSEDGDLRVRYLGERDKTTGALNYENGFEYFVNATSGKTVYYKEVNGEKVEMEYETDNDADYEAME
ncbi:MAG: hypothetical protein E7358_02600, partial [Clostridiales bacterium]|nr:hypothetical protein [Clostridiales bacterium]